MSQENGEIVRGFLVADLDELLAYVDPDIVWNPVEEASAHGPEAVRASTERWKSEWDDYELIPGEFVDMGDRVVATVRFERAAGGAGLRSAPASTTSSRCGTARSSAWISSRSNPRPFKPQGCGSSSVGNTRSSRSGLAARPCC